MTVSLSPIGGAASQFFNSGGVPLYGGKIYTYEAGTTTPKATYTEANGLTTHSNPIILDSAGQVPGGEIWLTSAQAYLFILKTSSDETVGTYDNIYGYSAGAESAVTEVQVATAGQTSFTLTSMVYTPTTHTLGVYIDGVNQVVNNSYVETSATTVTFVSGLHVGAVVKFININSAATSSDLVTYLPAGTGASTTTVQAKLRESVSVKDFGAVGDGVTDDSAAIQAAIDHFATLGGGELLLPDGNYLLNSALIPCNFLTVKGVTATITGGTTPSGAFFIVANATAAFSAPFIQKLRFENVGFAASGSGVGSAYAYKQTTLTAYSERCEFVNVNVWANMGGGFLGNFILTTWSRCELGYYSTPSGQFWPIYSKGDIAGNQTNANLIEDCYILNSLGSYTVYFEAGSDVTIRNTRFEHCDAVTTINLLGVLVSTIEGCYFEDSNGASTLSLINYGNDTTAAQGCSSIIFHGNYGSLSSNNTHLISHSGASGAVSCVGNRFEGLSGKNFIIGVSGNNKDFSAYLGNVTPSFSGIGVNVSSIAGSWTPTLLGSSGTNAHTYVLQVGKYTRLGRLVIAHFRVSITAKDAGVAGFATVGLTGLPTPDTAPSEGWTGSINYTFGITYPASTTQIGIAVGNINATSAGLIASGSGAVAANVPMTGVAASTSIIGCLMYETADA